MSVDWYAESLRSRGLVEITLWYRLGRGPKLDYNHLDYGHSELDAPVPHSDLQIRSWKGQRWSKLLGYMRLADRVVI